MGNGKTDGGRGHPNVAAMVARSPPMDVEWMDGRRWPNRDADDNNDDDDDEGNDFRYIRFVD